MLNNEADLRVIIYKIKIIPVFIDNKFNKRKI